MWEAGGCVGAPLSEGALSINVACVGVDDNLYLLRYADMNASSRMGWEK